MKIIYMFFKKIAEFQRSPSTENIDFIYGAISRLRVFGILTGQFINTEYERIIYDLQSDLQEYKDKNKKLLLAYQKLKTENIQLAEELKDREHIIETFEGQYYRKDENEE